MALWPTADCRFICSVAVWRCSCEWGREKKMDFNNLRIYNNRNKKAKYAMIVKPTSYFSVQKYKQIHTRVHLSRCTFHHGIRSGTSVWMGILQAPKRLNNKIWMPLKRKITTKKNHTHTLGIECHDPRTNVWAWKRDGTLFNDLRQHDMQPIHLNRLSFVLSPCPCTCTNKLICFLLLLRLRLLQLACAVDSVLAAKKIEYAGLSIGDRISISYMRAS